MEKKTVQRVYGDWQLAKLDLIESETALFIAACEEFQEYQDARRGVKDISAQFDEVWNELTSKQQNELRPELWGDAAKYINAPRKRRDMIEVRFQKALTTRGFHSTREGIVIRPNETVGYVVRPHGSRGLVRVDRRESLKRAIEWAAEGG